MLADRDHTLILSRFFRVGGVHLPATPTECRLAYNDSTLFVLWRCMEPDTAFPYAALDPKWWQEADWWSLPGLPSGPQQYVGWPPYPDEVDILIQPDTGAPVCFQFAATLQGLTFGCKRVLTMSTGAAPDDAVYVDAPSVSAARLNSFKAEVVREADQWLVLFQIPWSTLGGKPRSHFGFLPLRTRWRNGEFSSPVALGIDECLPVDLLIETHFSGTARVENGENAVCRLPSGVLRWQRPALRNYPDPGICRRIWKLQSSLSIPTDRHNLPGRLLLTQHWMDLMRHEGYVPLPSASESKLIQPNLALALFRQKINSALEKRDFPSAYALTDEYLGQLDRFSRWWYADGSPGDIQEKEWQPVTRAKSVELRDKILLIRCMAGRREVDLRLALPSTGGVRIHGGAEGYWRPAELLPLAAGMTANACSIDTAQGKIIVRLKPFAISFYDHSGKEVIQIAANSLSFRFDSDGKAIAVDFRHHLAPGEVIYGFGARYDSFNANGEVFTLWGTDGWLDHALGPANTTYKPLPVFHSSNGYMALNNSSYRLRADIGRTEAGRYRLTQHGPILDYYFWIGTPADRLRSYTSLTGRPPVPPKWVFEPWIGRGRGAWAGGQMQNAVAEMKSVVARYAELDIPHSAIYAEGPAALSPELNEFMSARSIRVLGYFMPSIGPARQKSLMPDLDPAHLPILHCGTDDLTRSLGYIDFTNPNAKELCRRALQPALDLGQAGSMVDYGDLTPDSASFYDGQGGAEMHNFYYYDYHRTISEIYRESRGDDFILFARGGAPGSQRWVGQMVGDHPCNFSGMEHVLAAALNVCACGYSTWGSDIGGYFGLPQPVIYMRWFQLGCFSPLMRPHGTAPRDPWYFGDAAVENNKFLAWTRENLLNYIYNAAITAHDTGIPVIRSMPVAFPGAPELAAISDQYMFGPDLLVAPVLNEDTSRRIIFPPGVWTSLWDGRTVSGPGEFEIEAPLDTIPVYLRPGAALPVELNETLQLGASMTQSRSHALIVSPSTGPENVSLVNARGEAAQISAHPQSRGFSWEVRNFPEVTHFLVYGSGPVSSVSVAGAALSRLTAADLEMARAGWLFDQRGSRVVVRLPRPAGENSQPSVKIELANAGPARQFIVM